MDGHRVVITGRDSDRGAAAAADISAEGGSAWFIPADLRDASATADLAREAERVLGGRVDVLVNNAGATGSPGPTAETTQGGFDDVYALNVRAPYFLTAALAPAMAARGDGVVVNVLTQLIDIVSPGLAVYSSAKAALGMLTRSWAAEFGPSGVRVNAVSPGSTRTEGVTTYLEMLEEAAASFPARRIGQPAEIAGAIAYLASPAASFVHGAVLRIDGGSTAL